MSSAVIALGALFLPSFLLVMGASHYKKGREHCVLAGTNAAVIGPLIAAQLEPVWTSVAAGAVDVVLASVASGEMVTLEYPRWLVAAFAASSAQSDGCPKCSQRTNETPVAQTGGGFNLFDATDAGRHWERARSHGYGAGRSVEAFLSLSRWRRQLAGPLATIGG